ncbi:spore cortex biosynthesis protein YabQ [Radiobacillus sp. PE A8.2]|uniref:spore cortex biosynthesis protein YabQ n=1 Tax=Radiobacillus sp. PE A8.2 TaxID=3380349 RepID=UPI00388E3042
MTLTTQFLTIISMMGAGTYLGAAIDTFRRYESFWKKRLLFSYIIEICFWLLQTLILFYILYLVNQGELRFYILLAIICGYAAYKSIIQFFYLKVLDWSINSLIQVYRFLRRLVYAILVRPITLLLQFIMTVLLWLWGIILSILLLILKIIWYPIRWLLLMLWRLVPKKAKNYFEDLAGFYSKIKNTLWRWYRLIKNKRR